MVDIILCNKDIFLLRENIMIYKHYFAIFNATNSIDKFLSR